MNRLIPQQILTLRRAAVLFAACWHLCLTGLILPLHSADHVTATQTFGAGSVQLESSNCQHQGQHHPDDCQLCKLDSQVQPVALDSPSLAIDPAATLVALAELRSFDSQFAYHFSGRAPPLHTPTTATVV